MTNHTSLPVPETRRPRWLTVAFPAGLILILWATLHLVGSPRSDRLTREIWNFGHVPLFGLFALLFLRLSLASLGSSVRRARHYAFAFAASATLGLVSEWIQLYGPRDADVVDVIRDVVGAGAALALQASFDRRLSWPDRHRLRRWLRALALFLVLAGFAPVAIWAGAFWHRAHVLPSLCEFGSAWMPMFVDVYGVRQEIVAPPPGWPQATVPARVARLTFSNTVSYPKWMLDEPFPDWRDYSELAFTLYSEAQQDLEVRLAIYDAHYAETLEDRFVMPLRVRPGINEVRIPLDRIRDAPAHRQTDLSDLRWVNFYAVRPARPFTVYLANLRLVP